MLKGTHSIVYLPIDMLEGFVQSTENLEKLELQLNGLSEIQHNI